MSTARETILVVDDSPTVRMGLKNNLRAAGFDVELAAGIGEAEALLARSPFALAIVDLHLPDGDGFSFLRRLTSTHYGRPIPALVISGTERLDARLDVLKFGADFVAKPCDSGFLIDRIRSLTGNHEPLPAERTRRVLVIDDSGTYSNAVALELRKAGHDVVLTATATEGLKYLALQKPDRVLIDVFLPDGDGIEVARRIREMPGGRELPLLLLTGRESVTTRKRAFQAGVTAFLTKDSSLAVLAAWVWRPTHSGLEGWSPASGQDSPSRSGVRGAVPGSTPLRTDGGEPGDLFARVVAASGLSLVLGSSMLGLALRRAGADPELLTPKSLARSLEQIEKTLNTFLPPEAVAARIAAIAEISQDKSHVVASR